QAALTYYTVFSIVPLLVVVFMSLRLLDYIPSTMPTRGAGVPFLARHPMLQSAASGILEAVDRTTEITSGIVGRLALLYAAGTRVKYSEMSLYIISGSEQRPPRLSRLLGYVALLALPPVVIAISSVLMAAVHGAFGDRIFRVLGAVPGLKLGAGAAV